MKPAVRKRGLPLSESLGAMVRVTHQAFAQDLQNHLADHDIPVGMWFYLRALWEEDGLTQRALSQRVGATEATTAQQLTKMEARGYVTRRRSDTDRRNSHVHLTRSGRALEVRLASYAVTVNANALSGFSAAEVRQLRDYLARMRRNLADRQQARAAAQATSTPPSRARAPGARRAAHPREEKV